jgi:hypothetical protein
LDQRKHPHWGAFTAAARALVRACFCMHPYREADTSPAFSVSSSVTWRGEKNTYRSLKHRNGVCFAVSYETLEGALIRARRGPKSRSASTSADRAGTETRDVIQRVDISLLLTKSDQ